MASLGFQVYRIASETSISEDHLNQANLYKPVISQFILQQANEGQPYCILCYRKKDALGRIQSECSTSCLVPVQRNVMTFIIQWLKDENLHIVDQENESYVLIGLKSMPK